jgi:predicted phosphodiesterase
MRTAILSDIHGNLTALEAVRRDLALVSPDLVFHGGDLADGGARPAEVVDQVRALGWRGVIGNADEMLGKPQALADFASGASRELARLFAAVSEIATATREALGAERIAWLSALPLIEIQEEFALLHASRENCWRAPGREASDSLLEENYRSLEKPIVVYAHIHTPFIRRLPGMTVANSGSLSLSYDGDPRAAYLLLDGSGIQIRRVEYDLAAECRALAQSRIPHAAWIAGMLKSAALEMP